MPSFILHHYANSPFSEKIRLVFGFKGMAWHSVHVPSMLPKPDVVARWQATGAQVLVGSASGAIEFELQPLQPLAPPRLWRTYRQRLWHDP